MADESSTGAASADPRPDSTTELSGSRILLVDDNQQNLELIQAYLEALPVEIETARDGVEAIEAVERQRPDVVLLDVMMPRMSGFEVCQKLKANPETRDIVVIMVTALHEVADYERAVESGTDDFLSKPVNKLELLTRVRSLLRVTASRPGLSRNAGDNQVLAKTAPTASWTTSPSCRSRLPRSSPPGSRSATPRIT